MSVVRAPRCPGGDLVDRFKEFILKDRTIDSSEKKPFTVIPAGIRSMAVSFRPQIDEKLLPPSVRIVLSRRRMFLRANWKGCKMTQEAAARLIHDALGVGIGNHIGLKTTIWVL